MNFADHVALGKQHLFDVMVNHLRQQGGRSRLEHEAQCAYRGTDGDMCAVGCLISDEEYCPTMERNGIQKLEISEGIPSDVLQLLSDMQTTHDQTSVDFWEDDFAFTARKFNLKYTEPAPNA